MSILKRVILLIGSGLASFSAAVLYRAATLPSRQAQAAPADRTALDAGALAGRLSRAIQFRTISHEDPARFDEEAFGGFRKFLEESFPKVHAVMEKEIVGGHSLLYTWNGQDEKELPILFAAHMDVVPADPDPGGSWTYPPFQGEIAEGYIWGRGALDDKVSLLGILESLENLLQEGYLPRRTLYFSFGHDEEVGGQEGTAKIAALLKSRGVTLEYVLDEGLTITEGLIPNLKKPVALIGTAEKGYISVELTAEGEGGHSGMPPLQTAVGILSRAVSRLEENQFPPRLELPVRGMFEKLSPEMPFGMRVVLANLWLFEGVLKKRLAAFPRTNAMVRTTTAPTIFQAGIKENILAPRARAVVNYRLLPGETIRKVVEHVRKTVNDPGVEIATLEWFKGEPSLVSDPESRGWKAVEQAVLQVFPGALVAPGLVVAATDSRHYAPLAQNIFHFSPIRLCPDDLQRIHGADERISTEDYQQVVRFYTQLIRNEGSA